ncbi:MULTISPECIES: hypothetical protein [Clostridium]|uniref:Uncharacterized protein n=1 Tax=Clostridium cibarium TaxID=2762247 RepID=A0ABR8PXH4_9CLOT|nr:MULTISPECIES: hypothetical protein [Clostridium]MBD7912848.1 hypothetical protein [Clostridium cibarium]
MSQVIDSKTEKHTYGTLFLKETVTTTLTLLYTGSTTTYGLNYDSKFSGIKDGHVQGGPISVSDNITVVVNANPKVTVIISEFNNNIENHYISLHVIIKVDIPIIGEETIYDQTLGGKYNPDKTGWEVALSNVQTKLENSLK